MEVFKYGIEKKDKLCTKVIDLFLELYGIVLGDIALVLFLLFRFLCKINCFQNYAYFINQELILYECKYVTLFQMLFIIIKFNNFIINNYR